MLKSFDLQEDSVLLVNNRIVTGAMETLAAGEYDGFNQFGSRGKYVASKPPWRVVENKGMVTVAFEVIGREAELCFYKEETVLVVVKM